MKKNSIYALQIALTALIITGMANIAFASWTGPSTTPPGGNVSAPINVSSTNQVKSGGIEMGSLLVDNSGSITGNLGIGNTSPDQKLDIDGSIHILNSSGASIGYVYTDGNSFGLLNSTGSWLLYNTSSQNNLNIQFTGDIGVYTIFAEASPGYQLNLNGYNRLSTIITDADYNYDWFRNENSGQGLYNQATGAASYSESSSFWDTVSGYGMIFRNGIGSTPVGYVYWDGGAGSNNFGLLSPDGNWKVRVDDNDVQLYNNVYMSGFFDTENPSYYVDPNNVTRLNQLNAGIFYDISNTAYYVQPSQTTNLNNAQIASLTVTDGLSVTGLELYVTSGITSYFDGYVWIRGSTSGNTQGSGVLQVDNEIDIGAHTGAGGGGSLYIYGDEYYWGSLNNYSDERLKKNITPYQDALGTLMELDPVTFNWIDPAHGTSTQIGLIAQDVAKVYPNLVTTDPKSGYEAIQTTGLIVPTIKAVQEEQAEINTLTAQVNALESEVANLESK